MDFRKLIVVGFAFVAVASGLWAQEVTPDSLATGLTFNDYVPQWQIGWPYQGPFIRGYQNRTFVSLGAGVAGWGEASYSEHPFLLTTYGVAVGGNRTFGALSLTANVSYTRYFSGLERVGQFGFAGVARYAVSDGVSATAFVQAHDRTPFVSAAAYPFVSTSRYGGYMSFNGDNVGVDVGAERYYDPVRGGWVTAPIITPKVKIWDSVFISVPVGGMVRSAYDNYQFRKNPPPPPPPSRR